MNLVNFVGTYSYFYGNELIRCTVACKCFRLFLIIILIAGMRTLHFILTAAIVSVYDHVHQLCLIDWFK